MVDSTIKGQPTTSPHLEAILSPEARKKKSLLAFLRAQRETETMYRALRFRAGFILVLLLFIYHQISANTDILSALNGNLITLIFGVLSIIVGLIAYLEGQGIEPIKEVLLLLLLITLVVTGVGFLLNFSPEATGQISSFPPSPQAAWSDTSFVLITIRNITQELLVLLALGQVYYLFVVILARLTSRSASFPV